LDTFGVTGLSTDPQITYLNGREITGSSLQFPGANDGNISGFGSGNIILADAVPEPSTWAMMILGFCGLGYLAYRRRSSTLRIA
jgi:hypothetical protein